MGLATRPRLQDRPLVEAIIGRPLRLAEEAIDVLGLNDALELAKDDLDRAIRAEMLRAAIAWISGNATRPRLTVTAEMLSVLDRLRDLGRREALLELERLGYTGLTSDSRGYAAEPDVPDRDVEGYLNRNLRGIEVRIEDELVVADLSSAGDVAVANALYRVPGSRDIASRVISTALVNGLADTWEENEGLVLCWEYTAVLDNRTCARCRPLDGKRYQTLDELFRDLPNFGPNPSCLGGGRCRCRAVPCDADEVGQGSPAGAEPEAEPESLPEEPLEEVFTIKGGTRGALVGQRKALEEARDALATLIRLPDRSFLPDSGVEVTMRRNSNSRGHYKVIQGGWPRQVTRVEINVGSPAHPAITFAHEVGHLLDHAYIGKPGRFETKIPTSSWAERGDELGDALLELNAAWEASSAFKTLDAHKGDSLARYMKSRAELFARSFAQWAGLRAERGELYAETRRDIAAEAAKVGELGDVPGWRQYPEFWQEGDYDRIDEAMTGVLRAAGLLRE